MKNWLYNPLKRKPYTIALKESNDIQMTLAYFMKKLNFIWDAKIT
jgi:hypothetical protein